MAFSPDLHIWIVLALTVGMIVFYVTEWVALELTSLTLIAALMLLFHFFPVPDPQGENLLGAAQILSGFANPALITVLALLVVGEGLVRTGALERVARSMAHPRLGPGVGLTLIFGSVVVLSAFLNNTPIVVIFIPLLQVLARHFGFGASRVMLPLSYAAILGGMTTLIGSSTNLLVSQSLAGLEFDRLGFFEFVIPGGSLALVGLVYLLVILPFLLPKHEGAEAEDFGMGRHYVAQISVPEDSPLIGAEAKAGRLDALKDITLRMVERGSKTFLPPYGDYTVAAGDVLVVSATRPVLTETAAHHPGLFHPPAPRGRDESKARLDSHESLVGADEDDEEILVEVMVPPSSRLIGQSMGQIGFRRRFGALVLGIQRRAQMIRARMTDLRLEGGDVLLVQIRPDQVDLLRDKRDLVVVAGTKAQLTKPHHSRRMAAIFLGTVVAAASGLVPIVIAAVVAAALSILIGALNLRQAARAIDRKVVMVIAASIALGLALQHTGAAAFVAHGAVALLPHGSEVLVLLSGLFLVVALLTNVLSNNACAVLFTPIAVSLAMEIGADARIFAITVLLAANCSFASPVGYQTNLMVLGPGRYQFMDFVKGGLPLLFLLWIAYTVLAPVWWLL